MFEEGQWWEHAEALEGVPLYTPFGTWRERPSDPPAPTPPQKRALLAENQERHQDARHELDAVVSLAEPLWRDLLAQGVKPRSRPSLRDRLREALHREHGIDLTAWRLKRLVARLGGLYGPVGKKALDIANVSRPPHPAPTRRLARTSSSRPRQRPSLPETRYAPPRRGRAAYRRDLDSYRGHAVEEVPGFPGHRVGSDGSFWTYRTACTDMEKILGDYWQEWLYDPDPNTGYVVVRLWDRASRSRAHRHLHTLILEAFAGPRPSPDHEGCHGNGDRTDNRLDNLRWDTRAANLLDKEAHGTIPRGERVHNARLDAEKVREIRRLHRGGETVKAIAARFGVSSPTVSLVVKGVRWGWVD